MKIFTVLLVLVIAVLYPVYSIQKVSNVTLKNSHTVASTDTIKIINESGFDNFKFVMRNKNINPASLGKYENHTLNFTTNGVGYFRTKDIYQNYNLHVEWRYPSEVKKGNSGILVWLQQPDSVWPKCIQIQLKQGKTGDLILMCGAKCSESEGKPKDTAEKYNDKSNKKPGEWNIADVHCENDSVIVYIDGILQNKATNTNISTGYIGFQLEGKPVEFRNIYLIPIK